MQRSRRMQLIVLCILQVAKCTHAQESNEVNFATTVSAPNAHSEESTTNSDHELGTEPVTITEQFIDAPASTTIATRLEEGTTENVIEDEAVPFAVDQLLPNNGKDSGQRLKCECDCTGVAGMQPNIIEQCANTPEDSTEKEHQPNEDNQGSGVDMETESEVDQTIHIEEEVTVRDNVDVTESIAVPQLPNPTQLLPTLCKSAGEFPHEQDCHQYYSCVPNAEGFVQVNSLCGPDKAFNAELKRCARDLISCNEGFTCEEVGSFPDPLSNSSYYWCPARVTGGFHKYHVKCAKGEIFMPQLGKCFIDFNNWLNLATSDQDDGRPAHDEKIIKAELKEFKMIEKARGKQQKLKEKFEQKLQKELAKKAKKEAKLKESSLEEESFVCTEEGTFPSTTSPSRYYTCISKKGKLKTVSMKCPVGQTFNGSSGVCALVN